MDIQWTQPFDLLLYILIGVFALGCIFYVVRVVRIGRYLKNDYRRIYVKLPIRILYFTLLLIALLGPSFGYGKKTIQTIGKDIYILLDLSESMNADDIPPTRLEKVKFELKNIVQELPTDRIGLIIFSSEAFLQCPLTYDKNILTNLFIPTLSTELVPSKSTDFYSALKLALDRYNALEEKDNNHFFAKVVIFISDGENFGEKTDAILKEYKKKGIKVITLGLGTQTGGKIITPSGYKRDKNGEIVVSKMNYKGLMQIAEQTEGLFFEISKDKNETKQLIETVQQIKGQRLDYRTIDSSTNKYIYFIWIALGLICVDILLTIKVLNI